MDTNLFIIKANIKHHNKYNYSKVKYVDSKTKVEIICPEHGSFLQSPNNHLSGNGCPLCNISHGEKMISSILTDLKIEYIREYIFSDCINIKPLRFDFYLPEYNICIEYDGVQHFKPILFWKGEEGFKITVQNDLIKNEYCSKNKIKLLRIKYTEKNIENISTKIFDLLK